MALYAYLAACVALLPGVVTFDTIVVNRIEVFLVVESHVTIGSLECNDICGKATRGHEDRKQKTDNHADGDQTFLHSCLTSSLS